MPNFCTNCGSRLLENAKFCTECGTSTGAPTPAGPPPAGTVYVPPPFEERVPTAPDTPSAGTVLVTPPGTPEAPAPADRDAGTRPGEPEGQGLPGVFGRYRVVRELGRGAMGVVYLARDDAISRNVAVKALHVDNALRADEREEITVRFAREARAAGSLSHPNIVIIHDVGEQDGAPYIAMELLEGATLGELLADGPMSVRQAVHFTEQMLSALEYAHGHGIVHRDIKPDNVFVLHDGRIKVADFGIAHLGGGETVTRFGQVIGTPGYMSPEQVKGETIGPASDVFSAGILLYEMITGTPAFEGSSVTTVMYKVVHEDLKPPRLSNPAVPAALESVIGKATAKGLHFRYASAAEMRGALLQAGGTTMPGL